MLQTNHTIALGATLFIASAAMSSAQDCVKLQREVGWVVTGATADGAFSVGSVQSLGSRGFVRPEGTGVTLIPLRGINTYAGGVSADGSTIVGSSQGRVVRWLGVNSDPEALLPQQQGFIGSGHGNAASADGAVIVGFGDLTGIEREAFRWTAATGMVSLGAPIQSAALDVSADGSVVVGTTYFLVGPPRSAFVWTVANGLQILPGFGGSNGVANAVSRDGRVVVGSAGDASGQTRAFIWTEAGGLIDPLIGLSDHSFFAAVSRDGLTAYGSMRIQGVIRAIAWSAATGVIELTPAPATGVLLRTFVESRGIAVGNQMTPTGNPFSATFAAVFMPTSPIGVEACAASPLNSIGCQARVRATGSARIADLDLTLRVEGLPAGVFGLFLAGRTLDNVPLPTSAGPLCLGGSLGRFTGAGQIVQSNLAGEFELAIDPTALPQPMGSVAAQPGETWTFQAWYRDAPSAGFASNTTTAVSVTFL